MTDWNTYAKNFDSMRPAIKIFIIKLMNGWLPVFHRTNKMMNLQRKCPLCQNDETIEHIFQCHGRQEWQTSFGKQLEQELKRINTSSTLQTTIIQHLTNLLIPSDHHPHIYSYKIFAGLIPKSWTNQALQLRDNTTTNQHSTATWSTKFSKWITLQGYEAWMLRNNQIQRFRVIYKGPPT